MAAKDIEQEGLNSQQYHLRISEDDPGECRVVTMSDNLIKSVNHTRRVQDSLNKPDPEKKQKPRQKEKKRNKKDLKRIIDTYA